MEHMGAVTADHESGRIPEGASVRWAMQLLSVTVQRADIDADRSGLVPVISRGQQLRCGAGFPVPVLM